jgi:hypothetical protein
MARYKIRIAYAPPATCGVWADLKKHEGPWRTRDAAFRHMYRAIYEAMEGSGGLDTAGAHIAVDWAFVMICKGLSKAKASYADGGPYPLAIGTEHTHNVRGFVFGITREA